MYMIEREHCVRVSVSMIIALCMLTGVLWVLPNGSAALEDDAVIRGNVSNGSIVLPDTYVKVMMFTAGGVDVNYTFTDGSGDYEVAVPGGFDYMVFAANDTHYMSMESVSIMPEEAVDLDFILEPLDPVVTDVTIMGYVKDEVGSPMSDGHVLGLTYESLDGMPIYANVTTADAVTGYFEVEVIPGDFGGGVVTMDYDGFMMLENGTDDPLVSGMSYWFNITMIPPSYSDDAMVHGSVTEAGTGTPIENALVAVEIWNDYMEDEGYSNFTFTDADGNYELNVTNGTARVMISKGGYSLAMFQDIDIGVGADVEINAELVPTDCVVRGNVTDLDSMSPIGFANVIVTDGMETYATANTDASGEYELNCFSGDELYIFAEAEGYSQDWATISLAPGEEIWMDFGLWPASSWLEGIVTDAFTGDPIEDAWVNAWSDMYEEWTYTDETGYYGIALVSGLYDVSVGAYDYMESTESVDVPDESTVVLDFELLPYDVPEDCMLYGWVNDSFSGVGVIGANVAVQVNDGAYYSESWTDMDGYYEMNIPAWEFDLRVTAWQESPGLGSYDATGLTELRVDFVLDWDQYGPNVTYTQDPVENVSTYIPSEIAIDIEESNLRQMILMYLTPWKVEDTWEYFYTMEYLRTSLDPFSLQSDLDYDHPSIDMYTVSESWDATAPAGWLSDGSTEYYLMAYEHDWGLDILYALRGYYSNDTLTDIPCTAVFDSDTGECISVQLDWGYDEPALDDASGEFSPAILAVRFNTADWLAPAEQINGESLDPMDVVGLTFTSSQALPSGEYRTYFTASDFGYQESHVVTNVTIDNDAPVANAGLDMIANIGTAVPLDGSLSEDAVGIVNYTWTFTDVTVTTLYGVMAEHTFDELGEYDILLRVEDAAGNFDTDELLVTIVDDLDPIADAGPDQVVEAGDEVEFNGSASTDETGIIENYTWAFEYDDDDRELYGVGPVFTFEMSGEYVVTLTVEDPSANTDTDTVTIRVNAPPVADAGSAVTVNVGDEVEFDGSGSSDDSGSIDEYTWTFDYDGEEEELSGVSPTFVFDIEGVYIVTLTVTDSSGLTDSDQVVVTVLEEETGTGEESFLEEYWWVLAIVAIIVVAGAASAAMIMSKKGGKGKVPESKPVEPADDLDDLPPPPDDF